MKAWHRYRQYRKTALCALCLFLGMIALNVGEVTILRKRIAELEMLLESKNNRPCRPPLINREIPIWRKLGREINMTDAGKRMEEQVTVLMFSFKETRNCLKSRIENIRQEYPNIKLIISSSPGFRRLTAKNIEHFPNIQKEGNALATMIAKVQTKYFLYLSSGVQLPRQRSDISATWLLHALEKIPELDFIGGSYLRHEPDGKYPVLEIPCYRLRMCNWTLSQTFEYLYSVDDMMICQETSSSFMGRTSSVAKVGPFDQTLDTMATTDFFLRAKDKAVVGLRPEVQFIVTKTCFPAPLSVTQEADLKLAFMRKYQLFILRDNFKREVKGVYSHYYSSLSNYNIVFYKHGTYASPMYASGLLFNLEIAADYLEANNISYFLDSGFPLGGIKTGGVLPWDIDVDLGFFGDWQKVHDGLKQHCIERGFQPDIKIVPAVLLSQEQGDTKELTLRADGEFGYNCLYEQPSREEEHQMMYVYIHGRKYPVKKHLFYSFRVMYGLSYLEMHAHSGGRLTCKVKGHHACVPVEFEQGGGHWREFYCEL